MSSIRTFRDKLYQPVSSASLGLFRISVGIILFAQTLWLISSNFIQEHIFDSKIKFKFHYFDFLEPLSPVGMKWLLLLMLASTVGIVFGRFFKVSIIYFTLSFTYFWLLDKSYFNNHYYFISLLSFILAFTQADSWGSLKGKNSREFVPRWQIFLLKSQLLLVLFIAGINKINYYWLVDFQPVKHILETKAAVDGYDWLLNDFFFVFFAWGGMLLDLLIGFALWYRPTRKVAIVAFVSFNLINYWLFHDIGEIGFFPFLLLACISIYLNPEKVSNKLKWLVPSRGKDHKKKASDQLFFKPSWLFVGLLSLYLIIQLIVPFRHVLYSNHVDWTGEGQRFSWRMKIMYKEVDMHFYLVEEGETQKLEVNVGNFLSDKQYTNLMYYPDFVPIVARYMKSEGERRNLKNPEVVATFNVGFNGGEKQLLFDSTLNLSGNIQDKNWVYSLKN